MQWIFWVVGAAIAAAAAAAAAVFGQCVVERRCNAWGYFVHLLSQA
jgi:hypothetical protein